MALRRKLVGWLADLCEVFVGQRGFWLVGLLTEVFLWIFHFERVFTWLSDVNLCFSKAVALAGSLAGWLAGSG